MISRFIVRSCAQAAGVRVDLALALAIAMDEPLGPGFEPLAEIIDAHGVDATRDILRRLVRAETIGLAVPFGRMA